MNRRVTVEVDAYALALVLDAAHRRTTDFRAYIARRPYDDDRVVTLEWAADCVTEDFEAVVGDVRDLYDRHTFEWKGLRR